MSGTEQRRLLAAGFFREFGDEARDEPSISEAVGRCPADVKQRIVDYLRAGVAVVRYLTIVSDVLDDRHREIGPLSILTDGTWAWRSDLAYYVERYDVDPSEAFLTHAASRGWTPPAPDGIVVSAYADPDDRRGGRDA